MFLNKIIAIGDIHGDYQSLIRVLLMCKVVKIINNKLEWIGGSTYVIQMGDTLDGKRPDTKIEDSFINTSGELEIIDLLINLDAQARNEGGRVISLIGNHELYTYYLKNDPEFIRDFVKSKDIALFKKVYGSRMSALTPSKDPKKGQVARLFGKTRPLILQLGEFIFIHGSLTKSLIKNNLKNGKVDIEKINRDTGMWLQGKREVPIYLKEMDEENPAFSRYYSKEKTFDETKCKEFEKELEFFDNANYVVMGHSTFKTINSACKNRLIRTDVMLSRAFGGKLDEKDLQALQITQFTNKPADIKIISSKRGTIDLK